ncbi:hypothetical protein WG906_16235 [Pedobacter sp. P351]|uniref:hypothetical protein n=1 Tax=Pedobacter superstes TaxID=3133441 RepID=UPI00309D1B50
MKRHIQMIGVVCLVCFLAGCSINKNRPPRRVVPIALIIESNEPDLNMINFNVYAYKVLDRLEDFNDIDLKLVEDTDTAKIILSISIDRYLVFPPETRVSRRIFRRNLQTGTDVNGRPVYQTISASADIVQSRRRTSALFNTNLRIKGSPGKSVKRSFSNNLNFDQVYVTNIQGDPRAVDPSIYGAAFPPMEPFAEDILMALSNQEMLDRLSREIRSYYSNNY